MKISNEELQSVREEPLELFYQGIKSPATKEKYTRTLRRILCDIFENVLDGPFEDRASQLVNKARADSDWSMSLLLTLSRKLKERTQLDPQDRNYLNPQSFDTYFKPLKKLFEMNDIPTAWRRVYATFPEQNNNSETRGYTREEIWRMLNFTKGPLDRSLVLVAASSGIRRGGFDLKWKDLRPVYKVNDELLFDITESQESKAEIVCAILTVYARTHEEYPAFVTPEAYRAVLDYRKSWIKDTSMEPKPNEPLFKKEGMFPMQLTSDAIQARITEVLERSGIRTPLVKGKRRHEVPIMNGFRRFFNKVNKSTLSKDSPLAALIKKEYMMDHTGLIKLDRNYFQSHLMELVEEYLLAVPNLTISDEERVKAEKLKLEKEKSA